MQLPYLLLSTAQSCHHNPCWHHGIHVYTHMTTRSSSGISNRVIGKGSSFVRGMHCGKYYSSEICRAASPVDNTGLPVAYVLSRCRSELVAAASCHSSRLTVSDARRELAGPLPGASLSSSLDRAVRVASLPETSRLTSVASGLVQQSYPQQAHCTVYGRSCLDGKDAKPQFWPKGPHE